MTNGRFANRISRRVAGFALGACAALVIGAYHSLVLEAAGFIGPNKTYTTDADFDLGILFNVNHDAPNNNQLQLSTELTTFPVMWIANAAEDTVSKIDTNSGRELARYRTWFGPAGQPGFISHPNNEYAGAAPSRTAVDQAGSVFVANRHFDGRPPDVIKILGEGGIDRNGNGTIETSSDADNNGVISGAEILPMADSNGNGSIDPNEIQDERIAFVARAPLSTSGGLGRSLCQDQQGFVWLGIYSLAQYFKLDPFDGQVLAGPVSTGSNTPYGCLVDSGGELWGASLGSTLLRLDTNTNSLVNVYNHGAFGSDYGIAIGNGRVYQAELGSRTYIEFDPGTLTFSTPADQLFAALGIAVDADGNIVVGRWTSGGVAKFRPDSSVLWSAPAQPGTGEVRGVQIDSNNDVWLIHRPTDNISKYDGDTGAALGVFPVGDGPYTYSDATGLTGFSTSPTGRWSIVQDSNKAGNTWDRITWNTEPQGSTPAGTSIGVEARTGEAGPLGCVPGWVSGRGSP
jgi:streptogramin lyase